MTDLTVRCGPVDTSLSHAEVADWSFATAREPSRFGAAIARSERETEHALGDEGATLCGVAEQAVDAHRHFFRPGHPSACPVCRERAAAAPTQPSGQERLYDIIQAAASGPVRAELSSALQRGANIRLWIYGPARGLAEHYARLDEIVEGGPAVAEALNVDGSIGLATVDHGRWQFVIVLPDNGPPLIARAAAYRSSVVVLKADDPRVIARLKAEAEARDERGRAR
ncbi:hypothetical protein Cci01nite_83540 [Catellatospora citrea]|uniref:Uncharacterized protein n=1 Tax=Catellatospora citrea TaxID=53366 RepID=A0A8J3KU69_9ACTN|nr:hypothetical protein Cci01nite_83540 [Catellatospora citrea]